jgi:hypothetical protein
VITARISPLACLAAGLMVGSARVLLARTTGMARPPQPWTAAARTRTGRLMAVIVACSWAFQLHRFGFLYRTAQPDAS